MTTNLNKFWGKTIALTIKTQLKQLMFHSQDSWGFFNTNDEAELKTEHVRPEIWQRRMTKTDSTAVVLLVTLHRFCLLKTAYNLESCDHSYLLQPR